MAKTFTRSVPDMTDAVPTGTMFLVQLMGADYVVGAANRYALSLTDPDSWKPAPQPPAPTFVDNLEAVKLGERIFVQWTFRAEESTAPGYFVDEPDQLVQINTTNFPSMDIPAFRKAALNMHNTRRLALGLDPVV